MIAFSSQSGAVYKDPLHRLQRSLGQLLKRTGQQIRSSTAEGADLQGMLRVLYQWGVRKGRGRQRSVLQMVRAGRASRVLFKVSICLLHGR